MRATTFSTPKVSRATRAVMMLELSPVLTAAKACGPLDAGLGAACRGRSRCRSSSCPAKSGPSRRKATPSRSITATAWPLLEPVRQRRPDPAAAHDHDVHGARCRLAVRTATSPKRYTCVQAGPSRRWLLWPASAKRFFLGPPAAQRPPRRDRCCRSGWRCPSSPATRCPRWPTPPRRSCVVLTLGGLAYLHFTPYLAAAVFVLLDRGGGVLPAAGARLPVRRRRLRGGAQEPRAGPPASSSRARCWSTTCSPWRCRSRRRRQHHLRVPGAGPVPGADGLGFVGAAHGDEPARGARRPARSSPCRRTRSSPAS